MYSIGGSHCLAGSVHVPLPLHAESWSKPTTQEEAEGDIIVMRDGAEEERDGNKNMLIWMDGHAGWNNKKNT